jgi:hypothetical protein
MCDTIFAAMSTVRNKTILTDNKVLKQIISFKYVFPFLGGNFTSFCALHSRHRRNCIFSPGTVLVLQYRGNKLLLSLRLIKHQAIKTHGVEAHFHTFF